MNETFANHPIFAHDAAQCGQAGQVPGRSALRALFLSGLLAMALASENGAYRITEANAAETEREAAASSHVLTVQDAAVEEAPESGAPQAAPVDPAMDREVQLAALAESAQEKLEQVVRRPVVRGVLRPNRALVTPTLADVEEELTCLALNIYFEARGEPERGKYAVGHVVMNRVADGRFPDTVCQVVKQGGEQVRFRCQFSWWCDGQSDTPREAAAWETSQEIAAEVFWGRDQDPTRGALWYHADYVDPYWRTAFKQGPKIGRHLFYQRKGETVQVASAS